jgi:hypothetical protein
MNRIYQLQRTILHGKKKTIHDQYIWSVYCITDKLDKKGNIYLYMQLRGNQQIIIQSNKS